MNVISNSLKNTIPVATNSVTQNRSELRQADKNTTVSAKQDSTTFHFVGSVLPTGNDYSVQDAIQNQWNKENSFNIHDVMNGKSVQIGKLKPSSDFITNLEKNGISTEIDWFKMGFDFKSLTKDELKINVDYMASRYAVLKEHITSNFAGEEQKSQLKKLEQAVNTAKESMAQEFANRVGGFLEENGASGEKEKIYSSILEEFATKTTEYANYIKNNSDYAGIHGTKNEWLQNDDAYMAARLREAVNGSNIETSSKNVTNSYSMEDLTTVGKMVHEMQEYSRYSGNIADTEETIGFKLGVLALKVDVFSKNAHISDELAATMRKATDGFVKNSIIQANKKLAEQNRILPGDEKGFSPLKTEDIMAVYNKIMSSYEKSGDASMALRKGATLGKTQYNSKMQSNNYINVYRYGKHGSSFWNKFDSIKSKSAYEKSTSERIADTWNSFMRQFSTGTNLSLQLDGHDFSKYA